MPINLQSKLRTIFLTPIPDSILTDSTLANDYVNSKHNRHSSSRVVMVQTFRDGTDSVEQLEE